MPQKRLEALEEKTIPCICWENNHYFSVVRLAAIAVSTALSGHLTYTKPVLCLPSQDNTYAIKILTNIADEKYKQQERRL
jgi:hypothetical protein